MKTFELHKCEMDMFTGQVSARYSFTAKDGAEHKNFENTFASPQAARAYLSGLRRDLLLQWLDDYVNHKQHIIVSGQHTQQDAPLQRCIDGLKYFHANNSDLYTICRMFLKAYPVFEAILPHPNNASHQSSRERLEQLKRFCEACQREKWAA